jgi:hypothetical protein
MNQVDQNELQRRVTMQLQMMVGTMTMTIAQLQAEKEMLLERIAGLTKISNIEKVKR